MTILNFDKYNDLLGDTHLSKESGKVTEVTGLLVKGFLPGASVGAVCQIFPNTSSEKFFYAEVVGFKDRSVLMMPLSEMRGVGLGSKIVLSKQVASIRVGPQLLGRVIDGLGQVIDGGPEIELTSENPLYREPRNPLDRTPI